MAMEHQLFSWMTLSHLNDDDWCWLPAICHLWFLGGNGIIVDSPSRLGIHCRMCTHTRTCVYIYIYLSISIYINRHAHLYSHPFIHFNVVVKANILYHPAGSCTGRMESGIIPKWPYSRVVNYDNSPRAARAFFRSQQQTTFTSSKIGTIHISQRYPVAWSLIELSMICQWC